MFSITKRCSQQKRSEQIYSNLKHLGVRLIFFFCPRNKFMRRNSESNSTIDVLSSNDNVNENITGLGVIIS
jgi:hypothetical protein